MPVLLKDEDAVDMIELVEVTVEVVGMAELMMTAVVVVQYTGTVVMVTVTGMISFE